MLDLTFLCVGQNQFSYGTLETIKHLRHSDDKLDDAVQIIPFISSIFVITLPSMIHSKRMMMRIEQIFSSQLLAELFFCLTYKFPAE
jgi:hypothetical protein